MFCIGKDQKFVIGNLTRAVGILAAILFYAAESAVFFFADNSKSNITAYNATLYSRSTIQIFIFFICGVPFLNKSFFLKKMQSNESTL